MTMVTPDFGVVSEVTYYEVWRFGGYGQPNSGPRYAFAGVTKNENGDWQITFRDGRLVDAYLTLGLPLRPDSTFPEPCADVAVALQRAQQTVEYVLELDWRQAELVTSVTDQYLAVIASQNPSEA